METRVLPKATRKIGNGSRDKDLEEEEKSKEGRREAEVT